MKQYNCKTSTDFCNSLLTPLQVMDILFETAYRCIFSFTRLTQFQLTDCAKWLGQTEIVKGYI